MPAKKKVKPGLIEPDKDALALNVHYTEEVTDEDGETTKTKKVKQVRLGNLDPSADIAAMASQVVADCKYIPSKNLGLVEQALLSLQSRVLTAHGRSGPSSNNVGGAGGGGGGRSALGMGGVSSGEVLADPREGRDRGGGGGGAAERLPPASMSSIDEYLELMYEENIETKVNTSPGGFRSECLCDLFFAVELFDFNQLQMCWSPKCPFHIEFPFCAPYYRRKGMVGVDNDDLRALDFYISLHHAHTCTLNRCAARAWCCSCAARWATSRPWCKTRRS